MTRLPLPPLVDLTKSNSGRINIKRSCHSFAPDAKESGKEVNNPLFGAEYYTKGGDRHISTYSLPPIRVKRNTKPRLVVNNPTGYTFDLHFHGLNITADADGASMPLYFGVGTKIGPKLKVNFPNIYNNSALLWYHAHPMFVSAEYAIRGIFGLFEVVDDISEPVTNEFIYGDNHLPLVYEDMEFNANGTFNTANLYTDAWRSNFGLINGLSCISWYSCNKVPFVTTLTHTTNHNLVKVDLLNGTTSFRNIYLGVCDKHGAIKSFYAIQTDDGLSNPIKTKILNVGPANRMSILLDLDKFDQGVAWLFMYDFDLTEVFNISLEDGVLVASVPDSIPNPTPNPTPIPGSSTNLTYPKVEEIPQSTKPVPCGHTLPNSHRAKKFLKIKLNKNCQKRIAEDEMLDRIRKVVFGSNHKLARENFNYLSLLNPCYYYNLPDISGRTPERNFILYPEATQTGTTEVIAGANRVYVDAWDSQQLDLN